MRPSTSLLLFCCVTWFASGLVAQNLNVGFGKNRVQYHRHFDEWLYYETPHFTTYWYGDARNVAIGALQMGEVEFGAVQQLLEHQITAPIEMLVFSDLSDLKQSNIGIEDLFLLRTGETKVVGNKIFVYFDGNHDHLRRSIREGVAGVLINAMLYGSNLQEIVQNAVLLNLPPWYTDGLAAYAGQSWSTELDDQLRNALASGEVKNFDQLARKNPRLAGQAFWHYIAQQFGNSAISNLLYLTRINRGLDAGFRYVLGSGYERTTQAMLDFYTNRYRDDARIFQPVPTEGLLKIKNKRHLPLSQLKISPDGQRIAWVQNDLGKWRVWVQDLPTGGKPRPRKCLLKGGIRNAQQGTDLNYPILAWSPDNQTLGVLYERRDVPKLALIDFKTGKKEVKPISTEFQRVYSMDFINPVDLLFAAEVRGLSDLYIYHTINRQTERLTQDIWDDLDANCLTIGGRRSIVWASNRPTDTLSPQRLDTILPIGQFDLFLYDLESRSNELVRLTHTPLADERHPVLIDSAHFAYLTDADGIANRGVGYLEPYVAYYRRVYFLKNGSEVSALDSVRGEWAPEKTVGWLAPIDSVWQNLDSTQIDSVRSVAVWKKRGVSWVQSHYNRGMAAHDVAATATSTRAVEMYRSGKKTQFFVRKNPFATLRPQATQGVTRYREATLRAAGLPVPVVVSGADSTQHNPANLFSPPSPLDSSQVIQPGWLFQVPDYLQQATTTTPASPRDPDPNLSLLPKPDSSTQRNGDLLLQKPRFESSTAFFKNKKPAVQPFNVTRIIPYRLRFRTDFVSTTMDNSLLFEGLDSYVGSPAGFRTPPPGVLVRANFKELLEDYVVEAGFRLPTTFNGAEYYIWLDDRKRRLDRRYALYRKTTVSTLDESPPGGIAEPYQVRTNTLLGQYEVRYPLNPFFSLRAMGTLRQDKTLTLTSDRATLETPDIAEQRMALRLSAVYDNTVDVDMNLKTGSRARVLVEAVKRFEFNTQPSWSFRLNRGFMTVLSYDARHYHRLDKHSIVALRSAGATTFGSERILYFLGGVDNWVLPRFEQSIPVPQNENFAYQTLAAHLRGFRQNIRNGSSFALLNTEVRVPIFKYFSKKPVLGNFWRNFQVVGFFDAGTAWTGRSPYNSDNPINVIPLQNPPTVFVNVRYFRDPLVAGYGFGLRIPLFGMYLRADYAWGIETRVIQKPMLHVALGTDF
jgi:hypothetical protein